MDATMIWGLCDHDFFFDEVSNKPKRACNKEKRKIGKGKGNKNAVFVMV